jgi:exo-beta-1,3-glucanase (GH17 family)
MSFMVEVYSSDVSLLNDFHPTIKPLARVATAPAEVLDAASLDLDLATLVGEVFRIAASFGELGGAISAVDALVGLMQRRKKTGVTTTAEVVVDGTKITFSGDLTPEQLADRVQRARDAFAAAAGASPGPP